MQKVLALTFVTFAIAAVATGMTAITTAQIVNAQGNDDGKGKSDDAFGNEYMKNNAQCAKEGGSNCNEPDDKNWGEGISEGADNRPNPDCNIEEEDCGDEHKGISDFRADGCKDFGGNDQETHNPQDRQFCDDD
jgi:hypothetical protein